MEDISSDGVAQALTEATRGKLKQIVERVERLNEEKAGIGRDIKDVYDEAKILGFDIAVIKAIVARRKKDKNEIEEFETIEALYLSALGEI